ncbi:MAG: DUF2157 domain-containing protein [Betaproteobacteria bacterium]
MNLRIGLYALAEEYRLDTGGARQLHRLAGLDEEPATLPFWLPRALGILAAALGGLGLVMWIAANWDLLGRFGRFALLQGSVLALCAGALLRPGARIPLGLLAFVGIGGLFAYFGQTYQTGADPWQLFALWALLALPLCIALRSDVLWAPWAMVAMTAISLWTYAHTGHRWRVGADDLGVHALAWVATIALVAALGRELHRFTGAGVWALRTTVTLAVLGITLSAIGGLLHSTLAPHYFAGLVVLAAAAALLAQRRAFDIFALSAAALGLNVLLVAGLVRLLLDGHSGGVIGALLVIGLVAAGLLAATVSAVMRLARAYGLQEDAA